MGPLEDPFTDYSGGPFVDIEEAWEYMFARCEVMSPYDLAAAEKLLSDLQLDEDIYFGTVYNITFNWSITRHELISLAHLLVTDPVAWFWLLGVDPETANECSVYVSLVQKEVNTQNWDDLEQYRTDSNLFFHDDTLFVDVDLTCVSTKYLWSKDDFPDLADLKDVQEQRYYLHKPSNTLEFHVKLTLTFNTPGRETLEDAIQKLSKRWEFAAVWFDYGIAIYPNPDLPVQPDPADTTVPVTEEQTTEPAAAETTGTPEKPTSPPTGDAGIYVACVLAAAFVGIVGVVVYRRRRAA